MKRLFVVLVVVLVFISSCGGEVGYSGPQSRVELPRTLEAFTLVGSVTDADVYRFYDGDTICYLVDGYDSVAIDCLP